MSIDKKAVQIYLRIKGPPRQQPTEIFKINGSKIRFKPEFMDEEEDILAQVHQKNTYAFDKIYQQQTHQTEVFNDIARDIVDSALQGYNGTIFAYGQTGSGKTFTMTGGNEPGDVGLIPRLLNYLYKQAEVREEAVKIKLRYLQIYNRSGYDLLDETAKKSKNLTDLKQVTPFTRGEYFDFQNLSEHQVRTQEQALMKFKLGDENRIVRKTPSNDQSSRSHCILMIKVLTKNMETGVQQSALINLVDLAGSERIHNSGINDQKIAKQGININLGLHVLGRVVMALGEQSEGKNVHIPYRESLLTMALKSSMGGNCKTRMIATINPDPRNLLESITTCRFAMNLTMMKNELKKNQYIDPWVIIKTLKKEVADLQNELKMLKGDDSKDNLDITDKKRIKNLVDQFILDQKCDLPIVNRLEIKEYLFYMRNLILKGNNGKPVKNINFDPQENEVQQNHLREIKNLRNLITQRDNEINLLLNVINEKKIQKEDDDFEGPYIKMEEIEEKKIAEGVVQALKHSKKHYNITTEDVEKKLIKPFQMDESEDMENAFERFKDSHIQKQSIQEKQSLLTVKERKKEQYLKKIQQLKHQRAKINTEMLKQEEQDNKRILPTNAKSVEKLREQINEIDDMIRKKFKDVKNLQLEINRLSLGKNKNNQKLKSQFDHYVGQKRKSQSEGKTESQGEQNQEIEEEERKRKQSDCEEKEVQMHLQDFMKARNKLFAK